MSLIKERRLQIDAIGSSLTTDNDDEGRERVESDNSFLSISNTESSNGGGGDVGGRQRRPPPSRYRMRTIDDVARLVFDDICDQVIRSEYESPSIPDVILEVIDEL